MSLRRCTPALLVLLAFAHVACAPAPQPGAPASQAAPQPGASAVAAVATQPIAGGPLLLREGIALRKVVDVGGANIRLAHSPRDGALYLLNPVDGLARVDVAQGVLAPVAALPELIGEGQPSGMAFGPDGSLFVVANRAAGEALNQGLIRRGSPEATGGFSWETLATTEPYPLSETNFDHQFNGIVVSPDGASVFVNSGSRTDHGEVQDAGGAHPGAREAPLTAKIFRLPADGVELTLPNDEAALEAAGYRFASGTRNAYDLAFAPNGELFAVDNGPDADYPDELNWLREGLHYGHPWRYGAQDNPQQFADYDPDADRLLHPDFMAVKTGTYRADPSFPPPPGPFAEPVRNLGPAATQYRAVDGSVRDAAAEGASLPTFTPHRSPLGLVFAEGEALPADLRSTPETLSAFVLSWGSAGGTLDDRGQDLLHMALTRSGDTYEAVTTQIAREFENPIDALLIENRLYVLEYGAEGAIWELSFE
jgi:hypothetical protein